MEAPNSALAAWRFPKTLRTQNKSLKKKKGLHEFIESLPTPLHLITINFSSIFFHYSNSFQAFHVGVSENRGTPKSSILIGISIINHPFWGATIFGNTHVKIWVGKLWNFSSNHARSLSIPILESICCTSWPKRTAMSEKKNRPSEVSKMFRREWHMYKS